MGRCKRHSAGSAQPASHSEPKTLLRGPAATALNNLVSRMEVGPNGAPQEFGIRGLRLSSASVGH